MKKRKERVFKSFEELEQLKKPEIRYIEPISDEVLAEIYNSSHFDSQMSVKRVSTEEALKHMERNRQT